MARPGKTVFDVAMMGGWAFAAVLTGLVALTMVDDTGNPATNSRAVAARENDETRLVTGSIDRESTASITPSNPLIVKQNETFNPFAEKSDQQAQKIQDILAELKALKREVAAFHVSTKRLRTENSLLKQRLVKLEQNEQHRANSVRVVDLPKRNDVRAPIHKAAPSNVIVDNSATGSIAPVAPVPKTGAPFDPFASQRQTQVKVSQEPLNMDLTVEGPNGRMMLPKTKPVALKRNTPVSGNLQKPKSEVVAAPQQALASSQTSFGLDLGQFVSIADLDGAWNEISISQRQFVGDLKPLSRVTRTQANQLALNLVVGPIQNAAQAATLCAQLKFRGYSCQVSVYQGQALATR